jgi:hypothetical protein
MRSLLFCFIFLLCGCGAARAQARWQGCLPDDVRADQVISVDQSRPDRPREITVRQRLTQLRARCRRGKLADARGRQIRFYRLQGCWGNAPADYNERMERQRREVAALKRRYTVVEMECNPTGIPIPTAQPPAIPPR